MFGDFGHGEGFRSHKEFGLRYWILALVYKEESTGAMIIDKMEQSSMGFWKPSPGSVYPILNQLLDEGSIELKDKKGKKYYAITEKGKELVNYSWFPWKKFVQPEKTGTVDKTLDDMDNEVEYLLEKSEDIKKSASKKAKLKRIIEKLKKV